MILLLRNVAVGLQNVQTGIGKVLAKPSAPRLTIVD